MIYLWDNGVTWSIACLFFIAMITDQLTTLIDVIILWDTEAGAPFPFPNETLNRLRALRQHLDQNEITQLLPALSYANHSYARGEMERAYAAALLTRYLRHTSSLPVASVLQPIIIALAKALQAEPGPVARIAFVRALQTINHPDVLPPLVKALRDSYEPDYRAVVASAIRTHSAKWGDKLDAIINALNELPLLRIHLDAAAFLTACLPPFTSSSDIAQDHQALLNALIEQAIRYHEDKRMTSILAALITEGCGRNLHRTNHIISVYEITNQTPSAYLDPLRMELNASITPAELQHALETRFYKPIIETHDDIKNIWRESIRQTQKYLRTRFIFTIATQIIGVLVFIGSIIGIVLFNDAPTNYLLAGVAGFALIVFSFLFRGTANDARQALTDIGVANSAYAAYIQRSLQISTGFAQQYLKGELTQKDIIASSKLVHDALEATVKAMRPDTTTLDDLINRL